MFMHINCISLYVHMCLPRTRRGLRGIIFTLCVCVCVCVCMSVCPCAANILVFYFSAIRRDIDLKSMKNIDLHRSKVKGTVQLFLKVQSYHKN